MLSAVRRGGRSSGLLNAIGEGVQGVNRSLVSDNVVDLDAAADGVAVTLGGDVDEHRGLGGGGVVGPRQAGVIDPLGLGIDVEVGDGRRRAGGAEHFDHDVFGVERYDLVGRVAGGRCDVDRKSV